MLISSSQWEEYKKKKKKPNTPNCLLYTSEAADEEDSGNVHGERIIKKKREIERAER